MVTWPSSIDSFFCSCSDVTTQSSCHIHQRNEVTAIDWGTGHILEPVYGNETGTHQKIVWGVENSQKLVTDFVRFWFVYNWTFSPVWKVKRQKKYNICSIRVSEKSVRHILVPPCTVCPDVVAYYASSFLRVSCIRAVRTWESVFLLIFTKRLLRTSTTLSHPPRLSLMNSRCSSTLSEREREVERRDSGWEKH